jgi:hypothetical protein
MIRVFNKPQAIDVEILQRITWAAFHFTDLSHNGFNRGRMVFNDAKIIVYIQTQTPDRIL